MCPICIQEMRCCYDSYTSFKCQRDDHQLFLGKDQKTYTLFVKGIFKDFKSKDALIIFWQTQLRK
jgi:hypothetical protein